MRRALAVSMLSAVACAGGQRTMTVVEARPRGPIGDAAAERYWPRGQTIEHPVVRNGAVEEYKQDAPDLAVAEKAFKEERWDDAKAAYLKALEECPTCYSAMTGWGDCEIKRKDGDIPAALKMYERALELNPYDAQVHAFRASALLRLSRPVEAVHELTEALTLRPNYWFALLLANAAQTKLHLPLQVNDEPFRPTGYLVPDPNNEKRRGFVSVGGGGLFNDIPWILYATCRWLGPNKEFKDHPDENRPWDPKVEAACLGQIADANKRAEAKMAEPGKVKIVHERSRAMERLVAAHDAGYIDEFALYEVQARMNPQVTLLLPPEQRERVRQYVEHFILGVSLQPSATTN